MDVAKTRLRKMFLRNRTQFHILSHLVRLRKQLESIQGTGVNPVVYLTKDEIQHIFHRSAKCVVSHLMEMEKLGYVRVVPLKPGGHSSKMSEWAITVYKTVDRVVHQELSLQRKIKSKQDEIRREYEDFEF